MSMIDGGDRTSNLTSDTSESYQGRPIAPPSKLPPAERFRVLQSWFRGDAQFSSAWRLQAGEDFEFRAGEQWSEDDKQVLRTQLRPIIVFNRVLTILKAVAGMEINGRHEIQFLPVNNENTAPNELLSAASKWMSAGCDAEDEESEAFDNCATCGMGWTENRVAYDENPRGKYVEESIDPLQMYWDRSARKRNLIDARRVARLKRIPLAEAMGMFPKATPDQLDARWANPQELGAGPEKSYEQKLIRDDEGTFDWSDIYSEENMVTIVHMQWYEMETYWIVADAATNTTAELSDQEYQIYVQRMHALGMSVEAARLQKKKYYQAFLGGTLLQSGPSPIQGRFIWQCITGELHRKKGTWFGLVSVMRDPQMWANKWLSQTLHILNTTAKGGIIAEEDAFEDQEQAEETYAKPDAITWAAKGALSGANPKIIDKKGQGITQGHVELMQFAISAIRDCTGINLELLGLKDANQPGVLEAQRKQAGMTVLATLFDSLRRFRKGVGHIRLFMIQNYFADGRLIRVAGPLAAKALPLIKDMTLGDYDVIIDDTPTSPNQKQANWAVIAPMIGLFKEQLAAKPELLAALLEYSPLPSALVELVKQMVMQDMQDAEQQQLKQTMRHLAIAKEVAGITKDQATANMNQAKAGATQATAQYDLAMAQNLLQKGEFDKLNLHLQAMVSAQNARKAEADTQTAQAKTAATVVDAHSKAAQSLHDIADRRRQMIQDRLNSQHDQHMDRAGLLHDVIDTMHQHQMDRAELQQEQERMAHEREMAQIGAQQQQQAGHTQRMGALADLIGAMQPQPQPQGAGA